MNFASLTEYLLPLLTRVQELLARVGVLEGQLHQAQTRIAELEAQLRVGSQSSSLPPSKDLKTPAADRSLRGRSGKTVGGQPGHPGTTLRAVATPDAIVEHRPRECAKCRAALDAPAPQAELASRHQVFDLPPPERLRVTEHRRLACTCPTCGHRTTAPLPDGVSAAPTSYGPNVRTAVAYLSVRQYLPVARLAELLRDLWGAPVSTGSIAAILRGEAARLGDTAAAILDDIRGSRVIGSDETVVRVCRAGAGAADAAVRSRRTYVWTWQTVLATFFAVGPGRSYEVIARHFGPGGLPGAVLVSDRFEAQLKTPCAAHQLCLPHLVRECNKLALYYPGCRWVADLRALLLEIERTGARGVRPSAGATEALEARVRDLLSYAKYGADKLPGKAQTLRGELSRRPRALTTCLREAEVPPDNNTSEQAVRNNKVKTKISGVFRSLAGAEQYCTMRTVIDTAVKRGLEPLIALRNPELLWA